MIIPIIFQKRKKEEKNMKMLSGGYLFLGKLRIFFCNLREKWIRIKKKFEICFTGSLEREIFSSVTIFHDSFCRLKKRKKRKHENGLLWLPTRWQAGVFLKTVFCLLMKQIAISSQSIFHTFFKEESREKIWALRPHH